MEFGIWNLSIMIRWGKARIRKLYLILNQLFVYVIMHRPLQSPSLQHSPTNPPATNLNKCGACAPPTWLKLLGSGPQSFYLPGSSGVKIYKKKNLDLDLDKDIVQSNNKVRCIFIMFYQWVLFLDFLPGFTIGLPKS